MRTLLTLEVTAGSVATNVPCPTGQRVRILAINISVSGVSQGDQVTILLSRSSQVVAIIASDPMVATITQVCAGLGMNVNSVALLDSTTVGGVASYNTVPNTSTTALPDIWWTTQVTVTLATLLTSVGAWTVTYETDEA